MPSLIPMTTGDFPRLRSQIDLRTQADVLASPSTVPNLPGVSGRHFRCMPPGVDANGGRPGAAGGRRQRRSSPEATVAH